MICPARNYEGNPIAILVQTGLWYEKEPRSGTCKDFAQHFSIGAMLTVRGPAAQPSPCLHGHFGHSLVGVLREAKSPFALLCTNSLQ